MKKPLLFLLYVFGLYLLYLWLKMPVVEPQWISTDTPIQAEKVSTKWAVELIQKINEKRRGIQSFSCSNVKIDLYERLIFRLSGNLAYEKPKNFRLEIQSRLAKESDLGSNGQIFWFWSKRMEPPTLYYAKHEELHKALLKRPLNPMWIMESLSLTELEISEEVAIGSYRGSWAIFQPRKDSLGQQVTKMTLVQKDSLAIIGHYLFGPNEKLEMCAEVTEFVQVGKFSVPKKMVICWMQENVRLTLEFVDPLVNVPIAGERFVLPNIQPATNMGD